MTKQKLLIVLVGLPGTGKSTFRDRVKRETGLEFLTISSDDYIEAQAKMIGKTYTEVFETTVGEANVTMEADVRLAIVKEFSVVWDQTNLRAKKRKKVLDKFNNYVKICINFDTPPEAEYYKRLYKRAGLEGKYIPIGILNSMAGTYQVPMIEEGFDKVFHNPDEAIEYIRENI